MIFKFSIYSHKQSMRSDHSDSRMSCNESSEKHLQESQRRNYVAEKNAVNTQYHRRNVLSTEADVSNAVFHRKTTSSNANEAVQSTSLSSTAAIQRKSLSNLHDQSLYSASSTERKSYSSLHRQGREHDIRGSTWVTHVEQPSRVSHKDNLSIGKGEFYGRVESRSYGNWTGSSAAGVRSYEAPITKRTMNSSSISFGDSSGFTGYRKEYVRVHEGPCPAVHIDKGAFKHTRDTKTHKFYLPVTKK